MIKKQEDLTQLLKLPNSNTTEIVELNWNINVLLNNKIWTVNTADADTQYLGLATAFYIYCYLYNAHKTLRINYNYKL